MATRIWQVHLDESGNFESAESPILIAGLLLDSTQYGLPISALQRALRLAAPLLRYPRHAAHARSPAAYLAGYMLDGSPVGIPFFSQPVFEEASAFVRASGTISCKDAVAAISRGVMPSLTVLKQLDAELQAGATLAYSGLVVFKRACDNRMRLILAQLSINAGRDALALVGAGAPPESGESNSGDPGRYERLLSAVLERIICLLRERGGDHVVHVRVLGRDLSRSANGQRVLLGATHVNEAAEAAQSLAWPAGAERSVRFEVWRPQFFNERVHPGLVLADHISNSLFAPSMASSTWRQLTERMIHLLPMPPELPCRSLEIRLPTLAADGPPRERVRRALCGVASSPLVIRTWREDQAELWAQAVPGEQP